MEPPHSLHEKDAKFQTYPPSTLHVKMLSLPKINVYNFRYKISVGILMKLLFLSHKCINKKVPKLVHRQIYYIVSSVHITSMSFLVPTLVNCNCSWRLVPNLFFFFKKLNMSWKQLVCSLVSIHFDSPQLAIQSK